jgi:hypothetical protein
MRSCKVYVAVTQRQLSLRAYQTDTYRLLNPPAHPRTYHTGAYRLLNPPTPTHTYIYIYIYMCIYMYIYIYRERERERHTGFLLVSLIASLAYRNTDTDTDRGASVSANTDTGKCRQRHKTEARRRKKASVLANTRWSPNRGQFFFPLPSNFDPCVCVQRRTQTQVSNLRGENIRGKRAEQQIHQKCAQA